MKKIIYISLSVVLFIFLSFIAHGLLEMIIIDLLINDFQRYSLGLDWNNWYLVHAIGSYVLLFSGILGGYFIGRRWWKYIYVEKRYRPKLKKWFSK